LRLLIPSVILLSGCRCQQVTSTVTTNHATAKIRRDSIYIHDSVFVHIRADTVYLEKWHTRWKDRATVHTDTVQVETTKTETVQVRYVPRFYKYCAALTALLLVYILIKFALWFYKRFHP